MRQLRLAFGFFTILPFSGAASMKEVAAAGYLLPLVAFFLGGTEGLAGWGLSALFGPAVTAALVMAIALLLTGLHHADGLADVGDAVMAGGGRERRLGVLKDRTMGIGALGVLFPTYLVSWAALAELAAAGEISRLPWFLVSVEVSARLSLVLLAVLSSPSHQGSGSTFIMELKGWRGLIAILLSLVILGALAVPLGYPVPAAAAAAAAMLAFMLVIAGRRWFGGANGDLLGASVELGRMMALLAAVAALHLAG